MQKHLEIRKEDEQHEVKLTRKIEGLKKEIVRLDSLTNHLDSLNKHLMKTLQKPSSKTSDLDKGDLIIIHKGLVINSSKNMVLTQTLFECLQEKMYKVKRGVYVFGDISLGNSKEIKLKAKNYLTHLRKVDWEKIELATN